MATTPDGAQAGPCAQEPVALPVVAAEKEQVKEPAVLPQVQKAACHAQPELARAACLRTCLQCLGLIPRCRHPCSWMLSFSSSTRWQSHPAVFQPLQ
eukprot:1078831-Rhodomonas_salina.1